MQRLVIVWRSFAYALAVGLTLSVSGSAQTRDVSLALAGTWEGTLGSGSGALRLVLEISRAADGVFLGVLQSLDQGGVKIPIDRIDVKDNGVTLTVGAVGGAFDGTMSGSSPVLTGRWTQLGRSQPLQFARRTDASRSLATTDTPAATTAPSTAAAPGRTYPLGLPLELRVPTAPVPFAGSSGRYLVHELHITNFAPDSLLLSRVEVLSGANVLATFEGSELNALLIAPSMLKAVDHRNLGAGMRAIAFLWIPLQAGATTPATIEHRVTAGTASVQGGTAAVSQRAAPIVGAPLSGGDWLAANGPSNSSIHRRALMVAHGGPHLAQRFAIDWVRVGDGRTFSGDQASNGSYHAYGAEALAVADGRVAATHDGIPENVPGITSRAVPITAETVAGNFVALELAGGLFAMYGHFQPGTVRVKEGDRVTRGQVLGLVGNSGNSTEPHLHFHIADGNAPWFAAEGVPYAIESYEAGTAAGGWERRQNVLPLENERVRFAVLFR